MSDSHDAAERFRARVRRSVLITGRVQAVGFRVSCRREALAHDVVGWAENRPDGTVFAVFEGSPSAVGLLVDWCRHGPSHAQVAEVYVHEEPVRGDLETFSVR